MIKQENTGLVTRAEMLRDCQNELFQAGPLYAIRKELEAGL